MSSGTLWVVATPIGNLEDASPRAVRVLREADLIACEDTRRTSKLRARLGIETPTVSCHRFNERGRIEPILERLRSGEDVALVSDGGTPAISDPGGELVAAALDAGIRVAPVPGPNAAAALLSVSGFSADRFVFEGFLPHRAGERRKRLRELASESRPVVLFESPHRIAATLADLEAILGDRPIVLGREMTKIHESVLRGTAGEIRASIDGEVRGECAIALAPAGPSESSRGGADAKEAARLAKLFSAALVRSGGDRRRALREVARETGLTRAVLWRTLQERGIAGSED